MNARQGTQYETHQSFISRKKLQASGWRLSGPSNLWNSWIKASRSLVPILRNWWSKSASSPEAESIIMESSGDEDMASLQWHCQRGWQNSQQQQTSNLVSSSYFRRLRLLLDWFCKEWGTQSMYPFALRYCLCHTNRWRKMVQTMRRKNDTITPWQTTKKRQTGRWGVNLTLSLQQQTFLFRREREAEKPAQAWQPGSHPLRFLVYLLRQWRDKRGSGGALFEKSQTD